MGQLMQEAIDKEEWERRDKGLPPIRKPKLKIIEPDPPKVAGQIRMEEVPLKEVSTLNAKRRTVTNAKGVRFIGFDVTIGVKDKKPLTGWMNEGDFYTLRREVGDRVDTSNVEF